MKNKATLLLLTTFFCSTIFIDSIYATTAGWDKYPDRPDPTYNLSDREYYGDVFNTDGDLLLSELVNNGDLLFYIRNADENISFIEAGQTPLKDSFMLPYHSGKLGYIVFDRAVFKDRSTKLKYINFGDINATVLTHAFHNCPELSIIRLGQKTVDQWASFSVPHSDNYTITGVVSSEENIQKMYDVFMEYISYSYAIYRGVNESTAVTKAFYNCPKLNNVIIDGMDTTFDPLAFYKCGENLTIYCPAGSMAEECAKRDGINTITIPEMSLTEKRLFDAEAYYPNAPELADVVTPDDEEILYAHWLKYGLPDGIAPSQYFDAQKYLEYNKDVLAAYGSDYTKAYEHYINYGFDEGRNSGGQRLDRFIYGDIDTDGSLTAADVSMLMQKVLVPDIKLPIEEKSSDHIKYADTDKDGEITASDALEIQQKVLDENYIMPCES